MSRIQTITEEEIVNEDELWRRIHPSWIIQDKNLGRSRPSSQAFTDPSMSVYLMRTHLEHGGTPESSIESHPDFLLAAFTVKLARDCDQRVFHDPTLVNPAHSIVEGRKTGSIKKRFAQESEWVISPSSEY